MTNSIQGLCSGWLTALLAAAATAACAGDVPPVAYANAERARAESYDQREAYAQGDPDHPRSREKAWLEHTRRGREARAVGDDETARVEFLAALDATEDMPPDSVRSRAALQNLESLAQYYAQRSNDTGTIAITPPLIAAIERMHGPNDPEIALAWMRLGRAQVRAERTEEGAASLRRAIALEETGMKLPGLQAAEALSALAKLEKDLGNLDESERLAQQSLEDVEQSGDAGAALASSLNQLAVLYIEQKRYAEAEPLARRGAETSARVSPKTRTTAAIRSTHAKALAGMGRYEEADVVYQTSLDEGGGRHDPSVLEGYVRVLRKLGQDEKADQLEDLAKGIVSLPPPSPDEDAGESAEAAEAGE